MALQRRYGTFISILNSPLVKYFSLNQKFCFTFSAIYRRLHGGSRLPKFICEVCFAGVNIAMRKMGALVTSTSEITDEGNNQVRINTQSTFKSANVLFPLGQEIDEHTMDGRNCKVSRYTVVTNPIITLLLTNLS